MAFGEIRGVLPGTVFATRTELWARGVHRNRQGGICGNDPRLGAESVLLTGAYADDEDLGELIFYTGQGKRHESGRLSADQVFVGLNRSLQANVDSGLPVRVVRKVDGRYEYGGLYRVEDATLARGQDGFAICRYRLHALPSGAFGQEAARYDSGAPRVSPPRRRETTRYVLLRDTQLTAAVKAMYDFTCQFCATTLQTANGYYAEGAHIVPLGSGYGGLDVIENVLCLCPNCHARFDHGGLWLEDDLTVMEPPGHPVGRANVRSSHGVRREYLARHRELFGHQ